MTLDELQVADREMLLPIWSEVVGGAPPAKLSLTFMRHIIAFEMQCTAQGGLTRETLSALERIRKGGKILRYMSEPKIGARLIREWGGVTHVVEAAADGFRYRGRAYRSLSEVARTITGARWSGPRFFGLNEPRRA